MVGQYVYHYPLKQVYGMGKNINSSLQTFQYNKFLRRNQRENKYWVSTPEQIYPDMGNKKIVENNPELVSWDDRLRKIDDHYIPAEICF